MVILKYKTRKNKKVKITYNYCDTNLVDNYSKIGVLINYMNKIKHI